MLRIWSSLPDDVFCSATVILLPATHICVQNISVLQSFMDVMFRLICVLLYALIDGIEAWSLEPIFLQCFDTVGQVT